MDILEKISDGFDLNKIFKGALFLRHIGQMDKYNSERVYLDEIKLPRKKKKEEIKKIFLQKMVDYCFDNKHFVFLVYGVSLDEIDVKSDRDIIAEFDLEMKNEGLVSGSIISSYNYYDEDFELVYYALGYFSSFDADFKILDNFLDRFLSDNEVAILHEPFFIRKDGKAIVYVYDDRGMDTVLCK